MSTIDMTQVAGIQAVNAEGKVIGTLTVDDLTELVATKIVQEAKNEAVSARSASVMSEASTLAATDEYEDQLALDTNPAYIRSLDTNGNPKRTAIASLAQVVGGLIGTATSKKDGLMSKSDKTDLISKKGYFSGDVNTLISPGSFTLSGSESIMNSPGRYGTIVVLPADFYIPQIFFGVSSINARISTDKEGSSWGEWKVL